MRRIRDYLDDIYRKETLSTIILTIPMILLVIAFIIFSFSVIMPGLKNKELPQESVMNETNAFAQSDVKKEVTNFEQPIGLGEYIPYDPDDDTDVDSEVKYDGVGAIDFSNMEIRQGSTAIPNNLVKNYNVEVAQQYVDTVHRQEEKVYSCSISWNNRLDEYQFDTLSALAGQIYQDSINSIGDGITVETRRATISELENANIPYNFYIDDNGSLVIFTVVTVKNSVEKEQISELKSFTLRYEGSNLKIDGIN